MHNLNCISPAKSVPARLHKIKELPTEHSAYLFCTQGPVLIIYVLNPFSRRKNLQNKCGGMLQMLPRSAILQVFSWILSYFRMHQTVFFFWNCNASNSVCVNVCCPVCLYLCIYVVYVMHGQTDMHNSTIQHFIRLKNHLENKERIIV